jgi:hypothetical protein
MTIPRQSEKVVTSFSYSLIYRIFLSLEVAIRDPGPCKSVPCRPICRNWQNEYFNSLSKGLNALEGSGRCLFSLASPIRRLRTVIPHTTGRAVFNRIFRSSMTPLYQGTVEFFAKYL